MDWDLSAPLLWFDLDVMSNNLLNQPQYIDFTNYVRGFVSLYKSFRSDEIIDNKFKQGIVLSERQILGLIFARGWGYLSRTVQGIFQ